jgi:hypothetical protein
LRTTAVRAASSCSVPGWEWLLACCDPDRLRAGDELDRPGVWSIPFFETDRATGKIS